MTPRPPRIDRPTPAAKPATQRVPPPTGKARLPITWTRNGRWQEWTVLAEGCYLLRANLAATDPAVPWTRCIQLTEAERAFRITKDELGIGPVFHQHPERVSGHILVCFLACALWRTLAQWMWAAGPGDALRTLVEGFSKIKSGDVVLRVTGATGGSTRTGCAALRRATRLKSRCSAAWA